MMLRVALKHCIGEENVQTPVLNQQWTVVLTGSLIATPRTDGWQRSTLPGVGLTGDVKSENLFLLWMDSQRAELHECYIGNHRRRLAFAILDVCSGKKYIANLPDFTFRHGVVAFCAQADSHVICHQLWMCEKGRVYTTHGIPPNSDVLVTTGGKPCA